MLSSLHTDFYGKGISSIDSNNDLLRGRPHGGMAILWRKSLGDRIKLIDYADKRLMGCEISNNNNSKILMLNVYMPTNGDENWDDFCFYLGKIETILSGYDSAYSLAIGDFNAHVTVDGSNGHKFGEELVRFSSEENLLLSDLQQLPADSYSYFSEAHHSTSWIDHILCTHGASHLINDMKIDYEYISSDHHPISAALDFGNMKCQAKEQLSAKTSKIKWDKLSQDAVLEYKQRTEIELSKVQIDHGLILCDDPHCDNQAHRAGIDSMVHSTLEALLDAGSPLTSKTKTGYKHVPGWNTYCKELHSIARDSYILWRNHGRAKVGILFKNMKRTRAQFKRALRKCKSDDLKCKADSLALNLL